MKIHHALSIAAALLGAIAIGAIVFSFIYWGFGFLRMGTTGLVAQAAGADDEVEVRAALFRALLIAGIIGSGSRCTIPIRGRPEGQTEDSPCLCVSAVISTSLGPVEACSSS